MREGEIGHDRSRCAEFVAVIKVVDLRIIEVDGFLHPAQAKIFGEKVAVLLGMGGHGCDVMEALDVCDHSGCTFCCKVVRLA